MCIASGIDEAVKRILEKACEIRTYYWCGFSSRNGSSRPKHSQQMLKMRGRGGRGGPERGFGGRGGGGAGGRGGGGTSAHTTPTGAERRLPG